jgi:type IX secretion system PorP/SprF family membrane protein
MDKMMRRPAAVWLLCLVFAQGPLRLCAQDLHFSQYFNAPLLVNPANTGFLPESDYRLGANYRNQWSSIMQVPYQTMSVFGDAQVFRNRIDNGWLGLGGAILRDVAGSGSLTSTEVYGSIAYHQMLGLSSLLTAGFNVGWAQKRIDPSRLKFPDQFDGKFFDAGVPTGVVLDNTQTSYLDMQTGLNYAWFPNERAYVNVGVSVQHINHARETFFESSDLGFGQIPRRYIANIDARFKTTDDMWIINPNIYYTTDAGATEIMLGTNAEYNLGGDNGSGSRLIGGLYYRTGDALIVMVGFQVKNIKLSFSYDITMSGLKNYNGSRGAYEFSSLYNGYYDEYNGNRRQSLCPSF